VQLSPNSETARRIGGKGGIIVQNGCEDVLEELTYDVVLGGWHVNFGKGTSEGRKGIITGTLFDTFAKGGNGFLRNAGGDRNIQKTR